MSRDTVRLWCSWARLRMLWRKVLGISDEVQRFSSSALESLNRGQWLSHHGPLESHCVWNCLERDFASFLNGFDGNP